MRSTQVPRQRFDTLLVLICLISFSVRGVRGNERFDLKSIVMAALAVSIMSFGLHISLNLILFRDELFNLGIALD